MTISDNHNNQPLTQWRGDTASLIAEMKSLAGASTDTELAEMLGLKQSAVANWRRRDAVPEATLIRFEQILRVAQEGKGTRHLLARAVAMRLPELALSRYKDSGDDEIKAARALHYQWIAVALPIITKEVARHMERFEAERGLSSFELAAVLIEDENFLFQVLDWAKELSAGQVFNSAANTSPFDPYQ